MAAELKMNFEVSKPVTEEVEASLLEMAVRRGTKNSPAEARFVFVALADGEELTRETPMKQVILRDTAGHPVATLIRTALLEANLQGDAAKALGVVGKTVREAGIEILKAGG